MVIQCKMCLYIYDLGSAIYYTYYKKMQGGNTMKRSKTIQSLLLIIIMLLGLAGCTQDTYSAYKQAEAKTTGIKTGKQRVSYTLANEADMVKIRDLIKNSKESNLDAMTIYAIYENLNKFKDFKIEFTKQYDKNNDKFLSEGFIRFNIYNFEGKLYKDREEYILEKLQVPKYSRFTSGELIKAFLGQYGFEGQNLSYNNDMATMFMNIIDEYITKDSIMSNGRKIINTPEGDIKVKELKITLKDEKLKELKNKLQHTLRQRPLIVSDLDSDKSADKRMKEMLIVSLSRLQPLSMEYTVYIDMNGYIMEKNINLKSKVYYPETDMDIMKIWNYKSQYWDLEKEQQIILPDNIDMEDSMDIKELIEQINSIKL